MFFPLFSETMLVLTCINYWMVWYTVPIFSSSFHFIAEFKRVRNIRSYVLSISEVYAVTRFIIFSSDTYNKVQPISVHGNCKKENTEAMRSGCKQFSDIHQDACKSEGPLITPVYIWTCQYHRAGSVRQESAWITDLWYLNWMSS